MPAAGSGTITTDINLAWNSAATIDYDEAVGTGSEINTAGLVAGQVVSDETDDLNSISINLDNIRLVVFGDNFFNDNNIIFTKN